MLIVSQCGENDKRVKVTELVEALSEIVVTAVESGQMAHEVERQLWPGLQKLGHGLLEWYFELLGPGDVGEEVHRDGQCLKRSAQPQRRPYTSVFGQMEIWRFTYNRGSKQRIAYAPVDERAGLPKTSYSYLLQDWSQHLSTELSYQRLQSTLECFLGFKLSVSALEQMNTQVESTVEPWWDEQPLPLLAPVAADQVTVLSADAKGVVVRSGATETVLAGRSQSASGPSPGKCKMAVLGAAYTVSAWKRTPEQVLGALFGETLSATTALKANDADYAKQRPKPCHKHVRAALSRQELGQPGHATAVIFPWLNDQLQQRDPHQQCPCVLLIDGQPTLWDQAAAHLKRTDRIEILDLLHALGYFWEAVHLFHSPGTLQAVKLMEFLSLALLEGKGLSALTWLANQAPEHGLTQAQRDELAKIRRYFETQRERIHYDQYLAQGLPIASGVIEGACRHVVNDRLNRTGMRWTLEGAQAMLNLRCVAINGLWDEMMADHIRRETERLYPHRAANDPVMLDIPQKIAA